ncbi:MAG: hypothetical protein IKI93_04490, partial [Clostridia bacterium]|nr:hypothetical protein [Clostridia bacterium]
YEALYKPVIDEFFRLASGEYDENNIPEGGTSLLEGNGWNRNNAMLWDSGCMIRDLSGDGVPELLIGSAAGEEYDAVAGTMIYALFTISDGQPKLTLEGAYRNAYCILEDGSIFNQGSGGAIYSIFGLYDLTADGTALTCRDYWFTHEKDGNFEDIRCWHNTTGEMDPAVSEELSMTLDEFWAKEEELAMQRKVLDLITFAEYGGVEKPAYPENPTVSAVYGNDYTGEYDSFAADDGDYAVDVVFTTDGTVRNFKVLSLTLNEITDDGYVSFFFEDLYAYGELTPDKGLAIKMSLPETIPFYGISYTDGTGADRVFSVNLSGFDGSVYLAEIGGVG